MSWKQPIDTDVYRWFGDDHLARDLFIHLLLKARHKDMEFPEHYKGKPYQLKKGQVIFGRNEYAKKLRSSPSGTRKALLRLQEVYSKVTSKTNSDYTVITILNYCQLTGLEQANGQAGDKQVTSKGQAGDTNKIVKNDKNVKKEIAPTNGAPARKEKKWKDDTPMGIDQFISYCKKSNSPHVPIIGDWAEEVRDSFGFTGYETYGEWQRLFFKPNLAAARDLLPAWKTESGRDRADRAMRLLEKEAKSNNGFKVSNLETLKKYMNKV